MKAKTKPQLGNCYEWAAQFMLTDSRPGDVLCHGWPRLQVPAPDKHGVMQPAGTRYGHAWIERRHMSKEWMGVVHDLRRRYGSSTEDIGCRDDVLAERDRWMPRSEYYAIGEIERWNVKRYTFNELRDAILRYKTYGPWPS